MAGSTLKVYTDLFQGIQILRGNVTMIHFEKSDTGLLLQSISGYDLEKALSDKPMYIWDPPERKWSWEVPANNKDMSKYDPEKKYKTNLFTFFSRETMLQAIGITMFFICKFRYFFAVKKADGEVSEQFEFSEVSTRDPKTLGNQQDYEKYGKVNMHEGNTKVYMHENKLPDNVLPNTKPKFLLHHSILMCC